MLKLTEENVNRIYDECSIDYESIDFNNITEENAPHGAQMLIPLPTGVNIALFDINKINEYHDQIGELLDQIPWMDEHTGVSFDFFERRNDGVEWTFSLYTMQRLYLLGVVSDQCVGVLVNGIISIGRINKDKALVTTMSVSEDGKRRILKQTIGGKEVKPNEDN